MIFIDKSNALDINDITNVTFSKNDKTILSYGYFPDFTVWVKFSIKNDSNVPISKVLEYDNPLTTNMTFYAPENNYKGLNEGFLSISENRKTINPIFNINLNPQETKTYYLKVSSRITTLIVKLNLWDKEYFYYKKSFHKFYLGLFFGGMSILLFYNMFIFFFTKDVSYFYYILYIFFMMFHHFFYVGLSTIYFEQKFLIYITNWSSLVVVAPIVALAFFTKSFLNSSQYKYWNKGLVLLTGTSITFAIFISFHQEFIHLRSSLTLLLLLYLVLLTVYAAFKKNRQAYFILFGWFILFMATLLMVLSSSGVFDIYKYISYPIEIALVLEATIFSIALADRINSLRSKEKILTQKIINQKVNENSRLEEKVLIKTKDLQVALDEKNLLLRELNHRVKNNLQMIISLLRLQSTNDMSSQDIHDILITIQNRINAMNQLHELLYKQDNITKINTYEYFYILCSELRHSYDEEETIEISLDINANINIEDSLYCGLILNELLTNSFKYAFPKGIGTIDIKMHKNNGTYELIVSDNGVGYKEECNKESLGTILIKSLVIDQLNGTIQSSTQNGVSTKINWRAND